MEIIIIAAILGLIPAFIAQSKGRSFAAWWLYGLLLFIVALIHVLLLPSRGNDLRSAALHGEPLRACPYCAESIKYQAEKCKHCGSEVPAEAAPKPKYNGTQIAWGRLAIVVVVAIIAGLFFSL